jgi:hypothetical protein
VFPDQRGHYHLTINGEKLNPTDAVLINGDEIQIEWQQRKPTDTQLRNATHVSGFSNQNGKQVILWGLSSKDAKGYGQLTVRTEAGLSDPLPVELALISDLQAKAFAAAIALLIFAVPIASLYKKRSSYTIAGQRLSLLGKFFLDAESNTYSLSKLQFYLWTAVAVFGYVFLAISRSLIQGRFELVDIPANLPGIILVSSGTTVLAAGISEAKGSKGAGDVQPSWSDFISAGGLVSSERFQFFVWTLLGVAGFLFMIAFADTCRVEELPKIPANFLALMGVSSAGYLGGKLARKPGPVIDNIVTAPAAITSASTVTAPATGAATTPASTPTAIIAQLVLKISGASLSQDASFKVDEHPVVLAFSQESQAREPAQKAKEADLDTRPKVIAPEDDFKTSGFAKILQLTISDPPNHWLPDLLKKKKGNFTIINPDGKMAVWPFDIA